MPDFVFILTQQFWLWQKVWTPLLMFHCFSDWKQQTWNKDQLKVQTFATIKKKKEEVSLLLHLPPIWHFKPTLGKSCNIYRKPTWFPHSETHPLAINNQPAAEAKHRRGRLRTFWGLQIHYSSRLTQHIFTEVKVNSSCPGNYSKVKNIAVFWLIAKF